MQTSKVVFSSSSMNVLTTDTGQWYRRAYRKLELECRHETSPSYKHRLKGFCDKFEIISSFLRALIYYYYAIESY